MIELFNAPPDEPFLTLSHVIEYDKEGHIVNPAPISIIATHEVDVIPNATDETLYDLLSSIPVQSLKEGFDEYELAVLVTINSEANDIARRTRRGVGNLLIGSSTALAPVDTTTWKNAGFDREVVVNEQLPDDELLIIYKGAGHMFKAVDAPFAFDGKNLRMLPNWSMYVRRLSLV